MLSGEHDPQSVVRAIKAGVNNYIPKPLNPQVFFEKIWQTISAAQALAVG